MQIFVSNVCLKNKQSYSVNQFDFTGHAVSLAWTQDEFLYV